MEMLTHEFLVLSRQLGDAQQRCSAALAAQAAQIESLQAEVVRLRGKAVVQQTRLAMAQQALDDLKAATPALTRRSAMVRHINALVERVGALSRECLRWRMAAEHRAAGVAISESATRAGSGAQAQSPCAPLRPAAPRREAARLLDAQLAAADLVICQTGCLSHDDYWRVQDHCRRTGKACLLVEHSLSARQAEVLAALAPGPALAAGSPQQNAHAHAHARAAVEEPTLRPRPCVDPLSPNGAGRTACEGPLPSADAASHT